MAEKSEGSGDSELTTTLHKILECPICLDVARPPVKHCANGHLTCSQCVSKMTNKICPLCQEPFLAQNPICLNNLLNVLPRSCCFSDQGCEQMCVEGDDHELYCNFKAIDCRDCKEIVKISQIVAHYQDKHPNRCWAKTLNSTMGWPDFFPDRPRTDNVPVYLNEEFYYLTFNNDTVEGNLKFTLESFPVKKPTSDFHVALKFKNGDVSYSGLLKAKVVKTGRFGVPEPTKPYSGTNPDEYVFKVPQSALHQFINDKKNLNLKYSFLTI